MGNCFRKNNPLSYTVSEEVQEPGVNYRENDHDCVATESCQRPVSPSSEPAGNEGRSQEPIWSRKETMSRMSAAIISPKAKHTATVIFLHGLGDSGHGWCDEFSRGALPWIKYIFPHAPSAPVTLNGGMRMPSWFDIRGLTSDAPQDEAGLQVASSNLQKMIDEEAKAVPTERIVIGGFSQGGAVALYTLLSSSTKLGGLLAFSTWLPLHQKIQNILSEVNAKAPVLQCHGDMDPVVSFAWGSMTAQFLKKLNPSHEVVKLHGVLHSSSPQEMEECKKFLLKTLAEK